MGQFGENLLGQLTGTPAQTTMIDPRTGYTRGMEARRVGMADELSRQYAAAQADPNYALPDIATQRMQEQEIIDDVYSRLGTAAGSGPAKAQAAKALADFRLGMIEKRATALNQLRTQIAGLTGQAGPGMEAVVQPGRESVFMSAGRGMLGGMGAGYGQELGASLAGRQTTSPGFPRSAGGFSAGAPGMPPTTAPYSDIYTV